ncbi:alcohol dehydrogenase catalytic domain-containing protein [Herbidospora cretacea]|uniref:alcohol dehydrogenase catalytic domain-containing protein n=1 Tax=Herbidospora cretacea TaxID=28444 RepID=UPI0004C305A4|nr:alcohol dehydrogenase catalytic domain-containing protein [Herbidospora cretacea]
MRAVVYDAFRAAPSVREVPDPVAGPGEVVVRVMATGLCRSDWHGWQGHDADIQTFPHVPGHEFAGVIAEVGPGVTDWAAGDRVTAPFILACGECAECRSGNQQVCPAQTQPGFTHWGSYAEYVVVRNAAVNLIALPGDLSFGAAAALGCRFATAYRAVVHQGRVRPGEWVAVHGCGGVGLSAVMIAAAAGARVVAVDVHPDALALAAAAGATETLPPGRLDRLHQVTGGGAHLSMDAFGSAATCRNSIASLRRRGRHVQIGLLPGDTELAMGRVIAWELELLGSHGMPAHAYPEMLALIGNGSLAPELLITRTLSLDEAAGALVQGGKPGVTLISP